jgi:hypothetical protein
MLNRAQQVAADISAQGFQWRSPRKHASEVVGAFGSDEKELDADGVASGHQEA